MFGTPSSLPWLRGTARRVLALAPEALRDAVDRFFHRSAPPAAASEHLGARQETAPPVAMLCWLLESPDVTSSPADPGRFEVRGWIAAKHLVEHIRFADEEMNRALPLVIAPRLEVTRVYGLPATGFAASCPYDAVRGRESLTLLFSSEGREAEIVVPAYRPTTQVEVLKKGKMDRILAILRCPACESQKILQRPQALECLRCGSLFPRSDSRLDFLTPSMRSQFDIVPTENVSSNVYDGEALNLIHRHRDGLILDCGAGLRDRYYGNVVNYEIVPYASTDVVGVGERLPFKDGSFDAVFSFAVLEHVKDPFACARELLRVLKPGGTLYCQVPFLQPVHGYPHHYHNMTLTGMRNLFGDALRVERAGPFLFGQPVFALSWMLNRYADELPAEERERFKAMRVEELLKPGAQYLGAPFVTELSARAREELSCCNSLIATKTP